MRWGQFGWQFVSGEVDDATILSEAVHRDLGYLAWSSAGNTDPILDLTTDFDAAPLTTGASAQFGFLGSWTGSNTAPAVTCAAA